MSKIDPETKVTPSGDDEIVIVGLSCRFGGSINNKDEFWSALVDKKDPITEVPLEQRDIESYYAKIRELKKMTKSHGGFIDSVEGFEKEFFSLTPAEAERMDPQLRLLLEETWSCCLDAGLSWDEHEHKTGVFVGICHHEFETPFLPASETPFLPAFEQTPVYDATGTATSIAANRISHALGFTRPSEAMDTAFCL